MCGIVGVVRRRSTRTPPGIAPLLAALDDAIAHVDGWRGDSEDAARRRRGGGAGRPGVARRAGRAGPARRPQSARWRSSTAPTASTDLLREVEQFLDTERGARLARARSRASTRRSSTPRTPRGRCGATVCAPRRAVAELAGHRRVRRRDRGVHVDPGGAVGDRPARGARSGFGGAPPPRAQPRARSRRPGDLADGQRPRPRLPVRERRGAHTGRLALVRVQGRGRDR